MTMHDVYFARQSIFCTESEVTGYELYFRSNQANCAEVDNDEAASSQVILAALLELEPRRFLGPKAALVNVPDGLLRSPIGLDEVLAPDQAVIQLLRGTRIDDDTVTLAQLFRAAGYRIAIDWFSAGPRAELILPYADIVKIDVNHRNLDVVTEHIEQLNAPNRTIMATKIETEAQFAASTKAGADWFQGYYLRKPQVERRRRPTGNQMSLARILRVVQNPEAGVDEIEEAIQSDLGLSYRLLKLANSAAYYLPAQISSIRHAVVLLGKRRVRQWATLAMMAGITEHHHEIYDIALIRAKMCEALGTALGHPTPDVFFMVGLLSVLDAVLPEPMEQIVNSLPVSTEVRDALLHYSGEAGAALKTVIDREECRESAPVLTRLTAHQIQTAYLEAITWSADVRIQMI